MAPTAPNGTRLRNSGISGAISAHIIARPSAGSRGRRNPPHGPISGRRGRCNRARVRARNRETPSPRRRS
jgi:hypothetical protein